MPANSLQNTSPPKNQIGIGIVGLGTVGSAAVQILGDLSQKIAKQVGLPVNLVAASSRRDVKVDELGIRQQFVASWQEVVNHPNVDIVVELVGGVTVAKDIVFAALQAGKSVVTANKALLATYPMELAELASAGQANLAFEAAVGGAIPIVAPLSESLAANQIHSIIGIVNGTTNYMLSAMSEQGWSYEQALKSAQELGYAEADPTADVQGQDAAAKIAILSSIAFDVAVKKDDVPTEGITKLSAIDLKFAKELGYEVKLLAIANANASGQSTENGVSAFTANAAVNSVANTAVNATDSVATNKITNDAIDVRVHPAFVKKSHPLASVNGVFNAIYVKASNAGEAMFYGEGAGGAAAASAVVSDIIAVARTLAYGDAPKPVCYGQNPANIRPLCELNSAYYLRLTVPDSVGVLSKTAGFFADRGVSINSALQQDTHDNTAELVYLTHTASEAAIQDALAAISKAQLSLTAPVLLRVIE